MTVGWMVAQDTFVAELKSGPLPVQKGQVFQDTEEVVKLDAGRGLLFRPLEEMPPPADKPVTKSVIPPRRTGAGKAGA